MATGAAATPTGGAPRVTRAVGVLLCLATCVAVRSVRGYRPFPSIDDFAYLPLAWTARDPSLFSRDTLLRQFIHHTPVWDYTVALLDRTVGEPVGFFALTLLLTIATVAAVGRLMRATDTSVTLLPLVAAVGFCGPVIGFGRGAYDGALGDAFHAQWVALTALLWCYDAFVRRRPLLAGLWLGVAGLSHPAVAAHGAFVILAASYVAPGRRWRELPKLALVALVVSLPLAVPLAASLLHSHPGVATGWSAEMQIRLAYVFRAPQHYLLGATPGSTWWFLASAVLGGLAALAARRIPDQLEPVESPTAALASVLLGQALLAAGAVLLYGEWLPERWRYASTLPYVLDLSRTSGLLLPLGAVLVAGALERRPARRRLEPAARELLWAGLLALAATSLLWFVNWRPLLVAVVLLGLALHVAGARPVVMRAVAVALVLAILGGGIGVARSTTISASLTADEAALYRWVAGTRRDALFIVPPGMQGFRFYGRRSVYVDFKLFPPSTPSAAPEWRRRMELVSAPDGVALAANGWSAVEQWDRTYAMRNTPERIGRLLEAAGADFLVWDRSGLEVPPYAAVRREQVPAVRLAFSNSRFEVYQLASPPHAAR